MNTQQIPLQEISTVFDEKIEPYTLEPCGDGQDNQKVLLDSFAKDPLGDTPAVEVEAAYHRRDVIGILKGSLERMDLCMDLNIELLSSQRDRQDCKTAIEILERLQGNGDPFDDDFASTVKAMTGQLELRIQNSIETDTWTRKELKNKNCTGRGTEQYDEGGRS